MKTKIKKLLLLTLIIASFSACKKKDTTNDDQNSGLSGQLHKITSRGNDLIVFSYNENCKLTKRTIDGGSGQTIIATYTYVNGKISNETFKRNGNTIAQYTYSYLLNGKLDKCNIIGATQSYWEMHYDNAGKIDYATKYISGSESQKISFTYTEDNFTEAQSFNRFGGTWEMQERYEFEYDNKHNPMYDLKIPFSETIDEISLILCPNNRTRIKEYDQNNILVDDTQYQYNYNAENYPSSVRENNAITYEYIYY